MGDAALVRELREGLANQGAALVTVNPEQADRPLTVARDEIRNAAEKLNLKILEEESVEQYSIKIIIPQRIIIENTNSINGKPEYNIEDKDIQYKIGSLYFADSRYKEAFDWIIKAGNQGNSEAQKELCIQYRIGWFVKSDNQKAFEWCEKSANLANSSGQFLLGTFYQRGNSAVKQDYKKAKEWFDKACDGGNQDGCDNYKILNEQGF